MADPVYDAAPQAFKFGTLDLKGRLLSFSGSAKRRYATQVFPKRDGSLLEDMGRDSQRLTARLIFPGATCAQDYQKFKAAVHSNPRGNLVHPIAGSWFAFCEGPDEGVDFTRSINEIQVTCSWIETQLDAEIEQETPDVSTAAQEATAQQTKFQQVVAKAVGALAKAQLATSRAVSTIDTAMATLDSVTQPLVAIKTSITSVAYSGAALVSKVINIVNLGTSFAADVSSFIDSATDLFDGSDGISSDAVDTLLGVVIENGLVFEEALVGSGATPADMAIAVSSVEETIAACQVLKESLEAARPPVITVIVPSLTDIISFAMGYYTENQLARASEILTLNRIPNPAAILAGTVLRIPSR
jgi:hypothetical protein